MSNFITRSFAVALLLTAAALSAPVLAADVNKASQAELESVKGIGPTMADRILEERKKAPFKNWEDMIDRVKGLGTGNAARFAEGGLTVGNEGFQKPASAAKATAAKTSAPAPAKADTKPAKS